MSISVCHISGYVHVKEWQGRLTIVVVVLLLTVLEWKVSFKWENRRISDRKWPLRGLTGDALGH